MNYSKNNTVDPNETWLSWLLTLLGPKHSHYVAPRGLATVEILAPTIQTYLVSPVISVPERKLSLKFMAAEAYWILSGDNKVETIAPYCENISRFSDNGVDFFGAYGPRFREQLGHVVETLHNDPFSRQAVLTLWRPNPAPSKDIPCTVAMSFLIRGGVLHQTVFMRSSDAWLGLPYDIFNFSMIGLLVTSLLNAKRRRHATEGELVRPGMLTIVPASFHLYTSNLEAAHRLIRLTSAAGETFNYAPVPHTFWSGGQDDIGFSAIMGHLQQLRDDPTNEKLHWWKKPHGLPNFANIIHVIQRELGEGEDVGRQQKKEAKVH